VPEQLTACFATSTNQQAGLEKGKWGPRMVYNNTKLHWKLSRNEEPM
jgi:hypothetical protein